MNNKLNINLKQGENNKRTTISISHKNYHILKNMGTIGESFDNVLSRILKKKEPART